MNQKHCWLAGLGSSRQTGQLMSSETACVVFPLLAALIYVFSALMLKRSTELGVGIWRTAFMANQAGAFFFSFLWLLGGKDVTFSNLWQPGVIALCLFAGQLLQFLALHRGDVSVAVPVFGLKVVLVAFFTPILIGDMVGWKLWCAAFLSVIGITFFNKKDRGTPPRNLGMTLIGGGLGAACFATFDVLVQKWGPTWGPGRLLPMIFWINGVLSLGMIPFFSAPLRAIKMQAWPWLLMGAALLSVQSILFVSTVATHGSATSANIIYASRGLLTVVVVWLVGHWFSNSEQQLGSRVLMWRLGGALMMLSAIALVLVH